ncbi:FAD dependent oxidoreductase [Collybia nuda]|uniref:FAD dependent oxidoreductase n=1 Tax=Collybia nuda TaxID=64659 RepID=A0A9P5YBP5_9AGAR|nr:FAD dependent oxidoreductase [Collybia nuda]
MTMNNTEDASELQNLDALVVGAGFSGIYHLHQLRKRGFSVKIFEAGGGLGGTWYWNCYPGARVDSDFSIYQLAMEDLWKDWNYSERFPDWEELREYFHYVEEKLNLGRDIVLNTRIVSAEFNTNTDRWAVTTQRGAVVHPRFLVLCTGFASKPHIPNYKGLATFEGECHHTARWPQRGVEIKGKRVGVIGTGASGVQMIQESGPVASHLTVFQRTANLAMPLGQHKVDKKVQEKMKEEILPSILRRRLQTFAGFHFDIIPKSLFDVTPEECLLLFEDQWSKGGFHFWLGAFEDVTRDQRANDVAYKFWRNKAMERINDPEMQRKLAPAVQPHPFGTKRPALEQKYFEVYNQPNVTLIDLNENPIVEITPKGVKTQDGAEHELDILALATGFDAVTGSITQIDIKGTNGVPIRDKWGGGVSTYLGITTANHPNMFFTYGPHAPTAFSNGPSCIEVQGSWIVDCLSRLRSEGITRIVPTQAAEDEYTILIKGLASTHLWNRAKSWYTGANIPGKVVEPLNFTGGIPHYSRLLKECADHGFHGFSLSTQKGSETTKTLHKL